MSAEQDPPLPVVPVVVASVQAADPNANVVYDVLFDVTNLDLVTHAQLQVLKDRLNRNLREKEKKTNEVNAAGDSPKAP